MASDVRLWKEHVKFPFQDQLPLDPHPPFNALTNYPTYPDRFYGSAYRENRLVDLELCWLENEHLKAAICPTLGGRLWRMIDKHSGRDVIHAVDEGRSWNAGWGFGYLPGGLELNYPFAHSVTNMRLRESHMARQEDGSCTVTISETERHFRTRWAFSFTLRPGQARLEQRVMIENPNPWETRYHYWSNCGIPADKDTVWIYPEVKSATHAALPRKFSWPYYGGFRIDKLVNVPEPLGTYYDNTLDGYFGYWSPTDQMGAVHFSDKALLPGKKYWSWGWGRWANHAADQLDPQSRHYGEMQAGRIIVQ